LILRWSIRPNTYHDSVQLMRLSEALAGQPGVVNAAAVMATPLNLVLLADDNLLPPEIQATPEDLLITVTGEDEASARGALEQVDDLLTARGSRAHGAPGSQGEEHIPGPIYALEEAAARGSANLAVIAVPGPYAAVEAFAALRAGLHVFLFSDNVPLEAEVHLKRLAAERDLMMMGPDCGTAIIGGVGLGFANRVKRGPVGIVGASGTGIQQLCSLLDLAGIGIAQAIGTGGRDLSAAVGGSMTRRAIWALEADPGVDVIAVVSKPGDPDATRRLQQEMLGLHKPAVVCLLGEKPPDAGAVHYTQTLADVARTITDMLGVRPPAPWGQLMSGDHPQAGTRQGSRVYGLYAGGTLCSEAAQVLDSMGVAHHLIDLGADEYTQGRAHPIIDPRLRVSMLADLAGQDDVGVVLFDVILGDLAHPNPAAALEPSLTSLRQGPIGARPAVVATLIGTRKDPQGLKRQRTILERAGAQVFPSNAQAASVSGNLVRGKR
jgi:FdrA protein